MNFDTAQRGSNWASNVPNTGSRSVYDGSQQVEVGRTTVSEKSAKRTALTVVRPTSTSREPS